MTQPEERTFTQAEVDAVAAAARKRERELITAKYADYDELKAKAAEADKAATQLDKIQQQMTAMSERAEKSERQAMIREVADELGISVKKAERLQGTTKDELLSDGRDFYGDDLKPGTNSTNDGKGNSGSEAEGRQSSARETAPDRGRPRESLRSGAPLTPGKPEETNPLKLAEAIPRY